MDRLFKVWLVFWILEHILLTLFMWDVVFKLWVSSRKLLKVAQIRTMDLSETKCDEINEEIDTNAKQH